VDVDGGWTTSGEQLRPFVIQTGLELGFGISGLGFRSEVLRFRLSPSPKVFTDSRVFRIREVAVREAMIGVGRAKQNLNVVDRPLGKGKAEVRADF
jgi:hypothetical protein